MDQVEGCPAPMTTGNREVSGEGSTSVGPKGRCQGSWKSLRCGADSTQHSDLSLVIRPPGNLPTPIKGGRFTHSALGPPALLKSTTPVVLD